MKWKTLSPSHLNKLADAKKSIYVLNTSCLESGDKATIIININDGTRRDFFKMPPTFIPMAVTDVIPVSKLLDSRDFREALSKGMLTLIDPDQAEQYLTTSDAQQEYENLILSEHSTRAKRVSLETEVARRVQVAHQGANFGAGPSQDVSAVDTVSNKVRGLIEDMISGNKTEHDVVLTLRRHQEALSAGDLSYVVAHATGEELRSYAQKTLAQAGTAQAGPVAPKVTPKAARAKAAPAQSSDAAFDFSPAKGDEMTPEEQAADARARAEAVNNQALHGQSAAASEIDRLLKR